VSRFRHIEDGSRIQGHTDALRTDLDVLDLHRHLPHIVTGGIISGMKLYFFRPLNKDAKNPWALMTVVHFVGTTFGGLGVAILAVGIGLAVFSSAQDLLFLPGSAMANAQLISVTPSHPNPNPTHAAEATTNYRAIYHYQVGGATYSISDKDTETDNTSPGFYPTSRVAYKVSNPSNARIVYAQTLLQAVKGDMANGVVIAIGGYCLCYIIAWPIARIKYGF
jgi:hypothetical protein